MAVHIACLTEAVAPPLGSAVPEIVPRSIELGGSNVRIEPVVSDWIEIGWKLSIFEPKTQPLPPIRWNWRRTLD